MDARARIAQSLTPNLKPRATLARLQAHDWPASGAGWRRLLRCWFIALCECTVPRGLGSSAAAMLLLASAWYGAVKGGHVPEITAQVQEFCDEAANWAGFRIAQVTLAGEHEVSRDEILTLAGITERSSLLFLDAARMRARLLSDPWIAEATVLKLYPGQLRIEIKERRPFALWQKEARIVLIAADGTLLERAVPPRFAALPQVVGRGAERFAADFLALLSRYPEISNVVEASVLVAERRWNLHLKSGVEVLLPEAEPARALTTLAELDRSRKLLTRDIVAVDLRLADRVTVRLSDNATAAREQAVKAAEKERKLKSGKKGSEA